MKRMISLALAMVVLLGVMFCASFTVSADPALTVSDACIEILKAYEGFCQYPYWDYGQWTVGYGTRCPTDKLDTYKENGITEEEALALLQEFIADYEEDLHYFINKYSLAITQNQFDAMFLFSYNCGSGWIYSPSSSFHQVMATPGTDAATVLYQFGTWSNAGDTPLVGLIKRRLAEANMYLNGVYSRNRPQNYCYVIYETNGGAIEDCVHAYDVNLGATVPITPTYTGYIFDGWYTEKTGGTQVTALDASTDGKTLYARWVSDGTAPEIVPGTETEEPEITGVTELGTPVTVKVTVDELNLRKGPGTNYTSVDYVVEGDQLTVTAVYQEENERLWGKTDHGWVCLEYTNYSKVISGETGEETNPGESTDPTETQKKRIGTVTASGSLYIRSGPGTSYEKIGEYPTKTRIEILEQKSNGSSVWGRTNQGWVSMNYVRLDSESGSGSAGTSGGATGTVKVNGALYIRKGAGTGYGISGYYYNGATVTILEQVVSGAYAWGKTNMGWISMDYVELSSSTDTTESTNTGTVQVEGTLNIRNGAGTSYSIAGFYSDGDKVTILEQKQVGAATWGRTDRGWISMAFVVMDGQESTSASNEKTVTAGCLNVRAEASTDSKVVGYLYRGEKIRILETNTVGDSLWGKTEKGWIALAYTE